jgi:hypothetical protein
MKFVVYTPGAIETSGGHNVLFRLAKLLSERGHDSKIFVNEMNGRPTIYTNLARREDVTESTIVIYPEGVLGNPLQAKRIVRWILYGSNVYPHYQPNEIIYYFIPFAKDNPAKKRLTIVHHPEGIVNMGLPRINNACYAISKGAVYPDVRAIFSSPNHKHMNDINLEGKRHLHIIEIFNTTNYFYCYDPCSFLIQMALMCGCIVIQHPAVGCTADEWKYMLGMKSLNGIAYGLENLTRAKNTISLAYADCIDFKNEHEKTIDTFISDMETGNYTYEPCYPFNDTTYSLQGVYR